MYLYKTSLVELAGIEPASVERSTHTLRPFPRIWLTVVIPPGQTSPKALPSRLSLKSAVFLAVSGLSLRSITTSVAGL